MCPFCNVKRRRPIAPSERDPYAVSDRILFEYDTVYGCAGLSPLTFPYVLIVTKRHFRSFANTKAAERRDTISALQKLLKSGIFRSGQLTVFEHGDVCERPGSECLEHFHLHIMDGSIDLIEPFLEEKPDAKRVVVSEDIPLRIDENYFLVGTFDGQSQLEVRIAPNMSCGRQYFRRMVAHVADLPNWDWRMALNEQMTQRLLDDWARRFPEDFCL